MFRNYLTIALRNIVRHKLYSFINIAGLAIGLACVIFVVLFVRDELSYDKWIPGTQNLYRIELTFKVPDRPPLSMAVVPYPMPEAMREEIPGVTAMTRLHSEDMTLTNGDRQFVEHVNVVDPGFFTLIQLPLITGDPATVFRQPDSIVLSQSAARKYFGDADPIGRTLSTGRGQCAPDDTACQATTISLRVTGIMRDLPHNTQLSGDIFLPNTSAADHLTQETKHSWISESGWGYVRLAPGTDPAAVVTALGSLFDREGTPHLRKFGIAGSGRDAFKAELTPFSQVHLDSSRWPFNLTPPGSWTTVYGVIVIGILILLVACFNFMNLATARAMLRAREIALRKTMGASRRQLIVQFLAEAVLMALLSLVLAFALLEILQPAFARLLQRPLGLHYGDWGLMLALVGIAVAAGLIGGSYPALVLSSFRPAATLRTNSAGKAGSGTLRNLLVVLQFGVSIGLGIAALVVFSQISFARNIDLGFRRDNILVLSGGRMAPEQRETFMRLLRANPGVVAAGQTDRTPFTTGQSLSSIQIPGHPELITLNRFDTDPGYPKVYGIRLVAGRLLSETRGDDRLGGTVLDSDPRNEGRNVLVNVAGARRLGFTPQQAVGQVILFNKNHVRIVGVLADTKTSGAREAVKPGIYVYAPEVNMNVSVHMRPDRIPETMAFIEKVWRRFSPNGAIQPAFLQDNFNKLFQTDERQGEMFGIFVGIAIFIACLGLFGLAAFTAGRRTREIGVRKVFGARARNIVLLLLWQFSIPVLVANLIAWPIAWYYLQGWLQGFAYRIALNPLYFVGVGLAALVIAWATIFAHALRVARANPIRALRYE